MPLIFRTFRRPSEVPAFVANVLKELRTRGFDVHELLDGSE